jgi:short-subunit dehydrogenase
MLAGKTVVVTGASQGIGAALARELASQGARVALLARNAVLLEQVGRDIRERGGEAHVFPVDLADSARIAQVVERLKSSFERVDILVNNAGAGRWLHIEETSVEEGVNMMAVPYLAAFTLTRLLIPEMLARRSGHIVNMTSLAYVAPFPSGVAYTAARSAMAAFSDALAQDLHGTGVDVTLLLPGVVNSTYFDNNANVRAAIPRWLSLVPPCSPEDFAAAAVRAIAARRKRLVYPLTTLLGLGFLSLFPGFARWMNRLTGRRRALPR